MATTDERDLLRRLETENERLKRAVEELSILNDLAREIGASRDADEVMGRIVRRSIRALGADQGVITLVDEDSRETTRTLVRTSASSGDHRPMRANDHLLGWMHLNRRPVTINEPRADDRFKGAEWTDDVRSVLCVPLIARSKLIGILTVFNKKEGGGFTDEDQRLLAIIAGQSAQVIENARLYEEEEALIKVREELRVASDIQRRLLPQQVPRLSGYELAGVSRPAENVGGDYFDFLDFDGEKIGVCVADVSGKGLPAALLMSNVQAALRARYRASEDPAECLGMVNAGLYRSTRSGSFVSMVYASVDTASHEVVYANAGHNRPLLCAQDGSIARLERAGIVLGAISDASYRTEVRPLPPGSLLLLYSDGVTEAMNATRDEFGEERLCEVLRGARGLGAREILDAVMEQIDAHAAGADQHDDVTMLVVRREG